MSDERPGEPVEGAKTNWTDLVDRIKTGDQSGIEELYSIFTRGIRFYLCRHLGPDDLDDRVHDAFLIVLQAIQRDELREPERLMGFVRTVVRRQVAAHIERAVHVRKEQVDLEVGFRVADSGANPEEQAIIRQKADLMAQSLREISPRDREILSRFYLLEQTQEQICEEMNLTETQFRLLKSRAKTRFGESGRRKVKTGFTRLLMRAFRAGAD